MIAIEPLAGPPAAVLDALLAESEASGPPVRRRPPARRAIIEAARIRFDRVRLRTGNPTAARFYEGLGFERVRGMPRCTHTLELKGLTRHE